MRIEGKGLAFGLPALLVLLVAGLTLTMQALSGSRSADMAAVAAPAPQIAEPPPQKETKQVQLAQEQPAQEQPAQSNTTTTTTSQHGGWSVSCTTAGEPAKKTCTAEFRVVSKENNNALVLVWLIGRDAQDKLLAEFATPGDVLIKPGVTVSLDEAKAETAEYVSCTRNQGCRAAIELTPKLTREMKQAKKASVGITLLNGKVLRIGVDINGIDQALTELGV